MSEKEHSKEHHGHKKHENHAKHHAVHKTAAKHKAKPHAHKTTHVRKKKPNYAPWIIAGIAVVIIIILLVTRSPKPPVVVDNPEQYGTVGVDFYVMSQCPYGTQVEDGFYPVLQELGANIDFEVNFIAQPTATGFESLHGQPEVEGDILHLCAQEHYPEKFMGFIVCQNKKYSDLVSTIDKCAEDAGIDAATLKTCAEGDEGMQLMAESVQNSMAIQASASPTIYINDQSYTGGRDAESFKRAICANLEGHPVCADIPACSADTDCRGEPGKIGVCNNPGKKDAKCEYKDDAAVKLTVVTSAECATCDPAPLVNALRQAFINMEVEIVDADTAEGQGLIDSYGLEKAPSFIFEDVDETYAWKINPNIPPAFRAVGDEYVLIDEATGATYILDSEKRAEIEEKTGITTGDNRPQIDFYVMSYCPYGNIAEEAIEPLYQLLKGKADFNPHFVIYSNYQGGGPAYCLDSESKYCSMHGVQELNQGLRELCAWKHLGEEAFFDFALAMNEKCNYQNADSCWEPVAEGLQLDVQVIKDCEANEWEELLSGELEMNQLLGVRGSPTVFVEGAAYSGARSPQGYGEALCAGFESKPTECAKLGTLGSGTAATSTGGCG